MIDSKMSADRLARTMGATIEYATERTRYGRIRIADLTGPEGKVWNETETRRTRIQTTGHNGTWADVYGTLIAIMSGGLR